jgi:hypothetical protein
MVICIAAYKISDFLKVIWRFQNNLEKTLRDLKKKVGNDYFFFHSSSSLQVQS